jgi:SAM-dependent methyltransferase
MSPAKANNARRAEWVGGDAMERGQIGTQAGWHIRSGPRRQPAGLNRVCTAADWEDAELRRIMAQELGLRSDFYERRERKHWEWALGIQALEEYGYLKPDRLALGLACGHEAFMYALTNHVKLVVGTDLYGRTAFQAEADPAILRDCTRFAPLPYRKDGLLVRSMDATCIDFADGLFDIVFSFSSVEHFGPNAQIKRAMREAHRVLKPGGVYVLAVDYAFQCPPRRWWLRGGRDRRQGLPAQLFTRDEVRELVIDAAGFRTVEDIAFDVPPEWVTNVFDTATQRSATGEVYPHIYLNSDGYLFTSLFLALFK